jgi:hypothetical protein
MSRALTEPRVSKAKIVEREKGATCNWASWGRKADMMFHCLHGLD